MPSIKVEGVDDLIRDMDQLSFREGEQVLAKAVRRGAQVIAEEQERRAPHLTGRLAASIRVIVTERSASQVTARAGPSRRAFYASFHEWGTKFQRSNPFVGPAFDAKVDEAFAVIRYDLGVHIDKAMKKHG